MLRARLTPTTWARDAGVAPGEILAFLSGHARSIAPQTAQKLAGAAKVSVETLFADTKTAAPPGTAASQDADRRYSVIHTPLR